MTGFVYAIGDGEGRVKLGWSADPVRRLNKINSDCPGNAVLLGLIEATRKQEAEVHELFSRWRTSGEWFRFEGPVAAFVDSLPKPKPRQVALGEDAHPLKRWRAANRTSLEVLGSILGTTKAAISRWENRKQFPARPMWKKIKAVTGIKMSDFAKDADLFERAAVA